MSRAPSAVQLAYLHAQAGRLDDAVAVLMRHLRQTPGDADAIHHLAGILMKQGQRERAEYNFARLVELRPGSAAARSDHGQALMVLGRFKEAIARFREALKLDPAFAPAHSGLAQSLSHSEDFQAAIEAAQEGARLCPDSPEIHDNLARALLLAGSADDAVRAARRGIEIAPDNRRLLATLAIALTYSDTARPEEVTDAYAASGRAMSVGAPPPPAWANPRDPDKRINIAYLSSDFREHSVARFIEPILSHHDAAAFKVSCYSTVANPDAVTHRLKALVERCAGAWVEARSLPRAPLAQRIRADAIDIIIELGGHSDGNRLAALICHAAPVQATYMGWATTTGVPAVGWRIVDAITDPPGAERLSTERLARLEGCFLCYAGNPDAPDPRADRDGPPVFGSFNALTKINPSTVRAWCGALNATPRSGMIIKAGQLEHEVHRRRITAMFAEHGIGPERIEFLPRVAETRAHLEAYNRIDVALDTFPYNGTTTTCEALWMGVPVVTLAGAAHAGRVSMSLLTAMGSPEWAAADESELAEAARSLTSDRNRLAGLRRSLRARVAASPLCDAAGFTRRLESACRMMWRDWCGSPLK